MMRIFYTLTLVGLIIFTSNPSLGALEVTLIGGVNNMSFHPDRETPHSASINFRQFQEYPFGFGDLSIEFDIADHMGFNFRVSRDNILRNSLSTKFTANSDYIRIGFGPFVGMDDNRSRPDLGVTGSLEAAIPGVLFLSIEGASSVGARYDFTGDHYRESLQARFGLWLPNIIPSISVNTRSFTRHLEDNAVIRDELTRYFASAEFFSKNSPVVFRIDAGYEYLTRRYTRDGSDITDRLDALFIGGEIRWQVSRPVSFIAGFEIPITFSAEEPMLPPDNRFSLYKVYAGFSFRRF